MVKKHKTITSIQFLLGFYLLAFLLPNQAINPVEEYKISIDRHYSVSVNAMHKLCQLKILYLLSGLTMGYGFILLFVYFLWNGLFYSLCK